MMIFAAGFGTRMKHLTADRPKPLIPVAGKALIDHALALARDAQCTPVVANLHYKAAMLADHLAPKGVITVIEQPDILDTGGGLRNALPALGAETVYTMNADAIWSGPNPLTLLQRAWDPTRMDALLMTVPLGRALGRLGAGDFTIGSQGQLNRHGDAVYCGAQIIKCERLNEIAAQAFSLNLLWDMMQAEGKLFGLSYPGRWCDVGHPEGVTLAEELLKGADV